MVYAGPSVGRFFGIVGVAMIATAWQRHLQRRALWLTEQEVVVANSDETHIVPKAGAAAAIMEDECLPYRYTKKPEWDNTPSASKRLYILPADPNRGRIQVEAAQGLTPPRLRAVVKELEREFAAAT